MKWYRSITTVALALVLLAGVSCTSDTTGIDGPVIHETSPEPSLETSMLLGDLLRHEDGLIGGALSLIGGVVNELLNVTGLLQCSEQRYEIARETIGPWGGSIRVGDHLLVIPRGALSGYVRITAEQIPGAINSVRFSPHGLYFEKPAILTLSYKNCENVELPKAIAYTEEDLTVKDVLRSLDLFRRRYVSAQIDHFSRYAVAY